MHGGDKGERKVTSEHVERLYAASQCIMMDDLPEEHAAVIAAAEHIRRLEAELTALRGRGEVMPDAHITETEAARLAKTLLDKSARSRELEAENKRLRLALDLIRRGTECAWARDTAREAVQRDGKS